MALGKALEPFWFLLSCLKWYIQCHAGLLVMPKRGDACKALTRYTLVIVIRELDWLDWRDRPWVQGCLPVFGDLLVPGLWQSLKRVLDEGSGCEVSIMVHFW